ncbi:DUF7504 family protein [Halorarius litoreus]|uniref:DUF7504 family protein n=1 Tax=Halorarius litoreus TaxID=2962676 RepID=UPI0020CF812D|nr:hypothetical protein [Halorarius litoreus]
MREHPSDVDAPSERRPSSFEGYLAHLKQHGSGLLVTGETPEWVQQHASRQLFGTTLPTDGERPRRRLVVRTDQAFDPACYLPTGAQVGDNNVAVVAASRPTRGATAAQSTATAGPTIDDDLTALTSAVTDAIDDLAATVTQPGELRVGVTSILPLVETAGLEAAVTLCDRIASATRRHDGMAHIHCPLADTDRTVEAFRTTADARVEIRQDGSHPVQCRWHTPYPELNLQQQWVDFV